jgi:hypothetical protein
MQGRNERGEAKLSSFIWLAVFAAVIYAGWHVIPIYIDHYTFADKVNEIARTPKHIKDDKLLEMLMKEVREHRLEDHIGSGCFQINTLETSRQITCEYERIAPVLPGFEKTFSFKLSADQPLI